MSEANIKISNVCFLQFFVKLNASVIQGSEVREKNAENREKNAVRGNCYIFWMLHLTYLKFYMSEANIKISNVCFLHFFIKLNASVIQGP